MLMCSGLQWLFLGASAYTCKLRSNIRHVPSPHNTMNRPSISPNSPPYPLFPPHSPYLRRVSPPGSPGGKKKCCYEQQKETFLCCCYTCPGSRSTSVVATVGICCLVLGYTIMGAFAFMALEGGVYVDTAVAASKAGPKGDDGVIGNLRTQTVEKLWSITENLNILYRENWTRLASEEVMEFQRAMYRVLKSNEKSTGVSDGFYHHHAHKWTFSSSFLYSLTLITTIGYGSISPRTPWGKLLTILYALIGIPLMLLYLSTTGDLLARSFRRLYGKMCGVSSKKTPRCPCTTTVRVPVSLCLVIVLAYICSGAVLFHRLENWSLLEGSYFCFTSLGTIGFGNLLPGQNAEEVSLCACSAYILTGMALVAMCFSLVQEEVVNLLKFLGGACTRSEPTKPPLDDESMSIVST